MNATATDTHEQHDSHAHGLSDATAIKIALILAAMTALEVSTYFVDFGAFFMPVLMVLMVVKFLTVVSYFMHLKFEHQMFKLYNTQSVIGNSTNLSRAWYFANNS